MEKPRAWAVGARPIKMSEVPIPRSLTGNPLENLAVTAYQSGAIGELWACWRLPHPL